MNILDIAIIIILLMYIIVGFKNGVIKELSHLIGIIIVLLGLYFLIINVSKTINNFINGTIILKLPSKILGSIVGFIKGYIFVFIGMIIVFIALHSDPLYQESKIGKYILHKTPIVSKSTGNVTESLQELVNITNGLKDKTINKTEANIKILKTLTKYKIIDKSTIQEYIKSNNVKIDVDKLLK